MLTRIQDEAKVEFINENIQGYTFLERLEGTGDEPVNDEGLPDGVMECRNYNKIICDERECVACPKQSFILFLGKEDEEWDTNLKNISFHFGRDLESVSKLNKIIVDILLLIGYIIGNTKGEYDEG